MFHKSMTRSEFLFWRFVNDVMNVNQNSSRSYPLVYENRNVTHLCSLLKLEICIFEKEFEALITIAIDETSVSSNKYLSQIAKAGKNNFDVVASRKFTWDEFSFDEFRNWILNNGIWSFSDKG
ncbi:hypothetical protein I4641_15775 [Waterburya agarophytonicola K14]|uniref:Uncharacterized protein n=1 Tax=Waterburya agarophytonicola KI4 TaxID=2874699 RepID=A0A964FG08_9CYAN|nr:hypothetical protein [Waterburya agarophytonicola]MCC0178435.1 hypothetical protein [Waterburya agarophytonicola KI4]